MRLNSLIHHRRNGYIQIISLIVFVDRHEHAVIRQCRNSHLAPSMVTIVRSVLQMIDQSFATERVSMYSMS